MIRLRPIIDELKILTKDRKLARFGDVMNYAQEDLIAEVERQINSSGAVRIVVLKARQLGISTAIEAIIFALSIIFRDFQSLIISHEDKSAQHILSMTKRYWNTYVFQEMHDEKYNGRKQLSWSDLDSNIEVATARNMDSGRSLTLHALHASEVASWRNPQELVDGLVQAIPSQGITLIFYESTAKGIGNFFHRSWVDAETHRSEFKALFYPWHKHPEYTAQFIPRDRQEQYMIAGELDPEERVLRSMGISDARLAWRRYAIANKCHGSVDTFHQEYPTTPNEAFLSTGHNVFPALKLAEHYVPMMPDVGNLVREGGRIVFKKHPDGVLRVYRYPSPDESWGLYQIGADPTHTTAGDKACAQVFNRRTLEQCAVLSLHCDPIELGKQCMLLGEWYNIATVAPEKEGPGYATVGYMLGQNYPRMWESQKTDKTPGKVQADTYGWGTNQATKWQAISYLINCLHQPLQVIGEQTYGFLIHDKETYEEMLDYVSDEKGGFCNGNGSLFDDCVMATGIAIATHFIDGPLPPYERQTREAVQAVKQQLTGGPLAAHDVAPRVQPIAPQPMVNADGEYVEEVYETTAPAWEQWDS